MGRRQSSRETNWDGFLYRGAGGKCGTNCQSQQQGQHYTVVTMKPSTDAWAINFTTVLLVLSIHFMLITGNGSGNVIYLQTQSCKDFNGTMYISLRGRQGAVMNKESQDFFPLRRDIRDAHWMPRLWGSPPKRRPELFTPMEESWTCI